MNHYDMKQDRPQMTRISRMVRYALMVLTMVMAGVTEAWGQDLSGTYFISSRDYASNNTANNFYLCPTEDWYYYQSTSPYYTNTPNGMPFMTTYNCRNGVYDVLNAVWSIEKKGNTDYYYIKHLSDGKYLTYNNAMGNNSNAGRMRVHLEASPADDDAALFQITYSSGYSCYEIITKKENSRKYLNVTGPSGGNGNINQLVGTNARTDGPSNCKNVGGIIGLYTEGAKDPNGKWYLEDASFLVCATPTITYNESNGEVSMSTTTDGADIYYTLDGTTPTSSSTKTKYVDPFTLSSSADIKAIAVKDGMLNSAIASKKVVDYTYHILNRSNNVAITKTVRQVVGTPLNGYADIPADIRSSYISDETIKFYDQSVHFDDEYTIDETPASNTGTADIYVTYSVGKLSQKYLKLQGARAMNVTLGGEYIFANSGGLAHESTDANLDKNSHLWRFYGGDPYAVQVMNVGSGTYLHYGTPAGESAALSLNTPSTFIIMDGAVGGVGIGAGQMELMAATGDANYFRVQRTGDDFTISKTATGDASLQVRVFPNSSSKTYLLIDRSGNIILSVSNKSETLSLPAEWLSPLADYQFWNENPLDQDALAAGIYKIREATEEVPAPQPITRFEQATGEYIYVTYTSNSRIDFSGATTYLLEYYNGVYFHQENGKDGIFTDKTQAVYPYNNGDLNLYVYGKEQWATQLASGASTRSRWLWKFVSEKDDPYHVKVMSNQNQSIKVKVNDVESSYDGNTYLRTYLHDGEYVTGVVAKHPTYTGSRPSDIEPMEYMLIGPDIEHLKLISSAPIDGSRRVVTAFEQYWKNNPTVKGLVGDNPAADNSTLTGMGWHRYEYWAYSAPWNSSTKVFSEGDHWFQTIHMGSEDNAGTFKVEERSIDPMLILLDQHGWEIMRLPLPLNKDDDAKKTAKKAALRLYDSPMVKKYHWYPSALKVGGYHKYRISDPAPEITVYENSANPANNNKVEWHATDNSFAYESTSLADIPYDHFVEKGFTNQDDKVKTDFYVTYEVWEDYASAYAGANNADDTQSSRWLLKQGGNYAKYDGSTTIATASTAEVPDDLEQVATNTAYNNVLWYLQPNFNIDKEMGYLYAGESGAQGDAKSLPETEADNYDQGMNGFDPYNVQIKSAMPNVSRLFTTNTETPYLDNGVWKDAGSSNSVTLRNPNSYDKTADGQNNVTVHITNATFMVVGDTNGNMRLMPRFDNTKVVTSFTGLSTQLAAATEGDKTLTIKMVPTVVSKSSDIKCMGGHYLLSENFTIDTSVGTSTAPFKGIIDGQLHTSNSTATANNPLVAYAEDAIIKNITAPSSLPPKDRPASTTAA